MSTAETEFVCLTECIKQVFFGSKNFYFKEIFNQEINFKNYGR